MQNHSSSSFFEYWDEAPHDWQKLLQERLIGGNTEVTIPILWGVHESSIGIRDFSKQSKLRIERLLTLIQNLGMSANLIVGFPAHSQAFPEWALREEARVLVPKIFWTGEPPYFLSCQVPSPNAPRVKEAFLSFFEELSSLIALYLNPGGPVKDVFFELKPLEYSQSLLSQSQSHEDYVSCLEGRYSNVDLFNKRFQTHFKDLKAVASLSGAKLIETKRPWLFSFDYRWCRSVLMKQYFSEVQGHISSDLLKKKIMLSCSGMSQSEQLRTAGAETESGVLMEGTFLQFDARGQLSPFIPEGMIMRSGLESLRWGCRLKELTEEMGLAFGVLPSFIGEGGWESKYLSVICGKYISRSAAQYLREQLTKSGHLFFPVGLPQYDENLESQGLFVGGARKAVSVGGIDWVQIQKEGGFIYYPTQQDRLVQPSCFESWLRAFGQISAGSVDGKAI